MNESIGTILIFIGSFFTFMSTLGLIKFKDFMGRLHSASKGTSFGVLVTLIGVAVYFGTFGSFYRTFLNISFIFITTPIAAHLLCKVHYLRKRERPTS